MSGFIVFCSFSSGHCQNRKGARGLRRSCENFVGGAQTWVLLLKNYVNWVLLWCTPDYIRHTLLIKLLPIIKTVISRCWKFFFVECGNGNVFLCHFSCSWHSLNRHIQMTSAFAVFSIPNSPSFAFLHFTFDMRHKISRDNFTYFKTINKKHKMYACLLLDFKALSIVIDFVVRLLGKV